MAIMESMYHLRRIHFQAYITGSKAGTATTTAAGGKCGGGAKGRDRQPSVDDPEQLLINDGIEPSRNPKCKSTLILLDKVTKIGRNPELVDVVLNSVMHSNMISRDHSEILGETDQDGKRFLCYKIFDHSLNGTYVNDTRVNGPVVLRDGDIIKFGHVNGAAIKPGEHAGAQQSAEFIFIFERAVAGQHYFGYSGQGSRLHSEKSRAYMQIYSDRITPQETFATTPAVLPSTMLQQQSTLPTTAVTTTSATTTSTAAAAAAAMRLLPQPIPTSMSAVLGQALTTAAAVLGQPAVGLPITVSTTIPPSLTAMVKTPVMGAPPQPPSAPAPSATPQHTALTLTPDDISAHLRSMVAADTLSTWNASLLQLSRLQQQNPHLYGSAFPAAAAAAAAYFQSASSNPNYAAAALWPQANIAAQWQAALQQQQQQQQRQPTVTVATSAAQDWQAQLNSSIVQHQQQQQQQQQKMQAAQKSTTFPLIPPVTDGAAISHQPQSQHQQFLSTPGGGGGAGGAARCLQASAPPQPQQLLSANSNNNNSNININNHHNTSALSSLAAVAAASSSVGGVITSSAVLGPNPGHVAYSSSTSSTSSASNNNLAATILHPLPSHYAAGGQPSPTGGTGDSMMMARLAAHLQQQQQQLPSALMASMLAQQQQQQLSASTSTPTRSNGPMQPSVSQQQSTATTANPTQLTYSSSLAGERTPAATTINSLAAAIFDNGQLREHNSFGGPMPTPKGSRAVAAQQRQQASKPSLPKKRIPPPSLQPPLPPLPSAEEEEMKAVESIRGEKLLNGSSGSGEGGLGNIMRAANDLRHMQINVSSGDVIASPPPITASSFKPPLNMNNCGGLSIVVNNSSSSNISGNNSHHGSAGDSTMHSHSPVLSNPSRPCSYQSIPQSPPRAPCPEPRRSPSDSPLRDSDDNWLQMKPSVNNGGSEDRKLIKHPSGDELVKSDSTSAAQLNGDQEQLESKPKPIRQGRKSNEVARLLNDLTAGNCNNQSLLYSACNNGVEWSWRRAASLVAAKWGDRGRQSDSDESNNDYWPSETTRCPKLWGEIEEKKNRKMKSPEKLRRKCEGEKKGDDGCRSDEPKCCLSPSDDPEIQLIKETLGSWQYQAQRSQAKWTTTGGEGTANGGSASAGGRNGSNASGGVDGGSGGSCTLDLYKKKRTLRLEERKLKEMAKKKAHKMMRQISDESSEDDGDGADTMNSVQTRLDPSSSDEDCASGPSPKYLSSSPARHRPKAKRVGSGVAKPGELHTVRKKPTANEEKKKSASQSSRARKRKPAAASSSKMEAKAGDYGGKRNNSGGGRSDSDDSDRSLSSLNSADGDDATPPAAKRSSNGSSSKHNSSSLNSSGNAASSQTGKRAPKQKHRSKPKGGLKGYERLQPLTPPGDASSSDGRPEEWKFHDPDKDLCAHKRCQRPPDLSINWVQCDDCDEWYHSVCALGSNSDVEEELDFHCGCAGATSTTVIVASGRKR